MVYKVVLRWVAPGNQASTLPSITRIVSKPALFDTPGLGLRSDEEPGPSPARRGGTGVVDRDGVALSLSDP